LAFTSTIKGQTAGVGGQKRIWGTWDSTGVTTGTITWKGSTQVYNPVAAGYCYSTTVTTALSPPQLTAGTLVLTTTDSGAAGYWWVDVQ